MDKPPLIRGGQGREPEELEGQAIILAISLGLLLLILITFYLVWRFW